MRSTRRNARLILEKLYVATFRGLESFMLSSLQSSKVTAIYAECEGKSNLSDMKKKVPLNSSINALVPSENIPFQL